MINTALAGLKGMNLQVFIDDVCIATKTWPEHISMLKDTLQAVIAANLKIKANKCVFGASSVKFLGHEISRYGIRQDPDKLKALTKMPAPQDAKGVKQVLGMFSYYRKFVNNFAMLAEPLTKLTRKGIDFVWEDEQREAYDKIINELAKNATLAHFNHKDPVLVKTDASRKGIAGMLLQRQSDEWRLITCCSRRLSSSESNYGITDLEGLAVVYTVSKLRPYLLGKKFQILVDHCALCVLNKRTPASARLRRWAITLSEFDFEIIYTKGNQHCDIDCLSRAPVDDPIDPYLENAVYMITPFDQLDWRGSYTDKESLDILQKAFDKEDGFHLQNDIIYKDDLLYVSTSKRYELVKGIHTSSMTGHPGINAMLSKLKENYWWPNMREVVAEVIKNCTTCALQKPDRVRPAGQMYTFNICQPGEQVAVDLIEKITESLNGNQYIIVAIDMFTRFVEAKAVPDKGAPTFTQFLIEYCGRFGVPHSFLTDQSTTFCNEFTNQIMKVFGAAHIKSTPYHSQGNAVVERVNQTLEEKIRVVLDDPLQEKNWDAVLPIAVLALNTSYHSSIGRTPYEMTFGGRPPLQDKNIVDKTTPYDLHAKLVKSYLKECYSTAVAIQSTTQEKARQYYESKRRAALFQLNDTVAVKTPSRSSKLSPKYTGPFKVIGVKNDIYTLEDLQSKRKTTRHVSDLKAMKTSNNILLITTILSLKLLIVQCNCELLFDRVRPIIWTRIKSQVNLGAAEYDVHFAYQSPCHLFEKYVRKGLGDSENLTSDDEASLEAFDRNCKALYIIEWEEEIKQLTNVKIPDRSHDHIFKIAKPYKENGLSRERRDSPPKIDLSILRKNETHGGLPGVVGWRIFTAIATGPFSHFAYGPTQIESAATERLIELIMLRNALLKAGNLEIYLAKLVYESENRFKRDDGREEAAKEANILTDYTTWEIIGMLACPICIPWIHNDARVRSLNIKIQKVKEEITQKLDSTDINTFLDRVAKEGKISKRDIPNLERRKRDIFDTIVSQVVQQTIGVFTGNVISNLVSFVIDKLDPNSVGNRLSRLTTAYEELKNNMEISRQVDRGILDNLDKLSNIVQATVERVNQHIRRFPQYTWLASLIVNKMTQSSLDLQRIVDEAGKGRIAIEPFVRLTGIVGLKEFSSDDTALISIKRINEYTLNFHFTAMQESRDTKAYKVQAFRHWDNLDETPKLLKYTGAEYLIYNETSNCIRSLPGLPDRYISQQCLELDGEDPALNQWETVAETENIERYANESQIFKTILHNYIYCFPGSIKIDNKNYKCPIDAFRLGSNHEFMTARERHVPSMFSTNTTLKDLAIDTVHAGHFRDDSDTVQHLAMFDQLRNQRKLAHNLTLTQESSYMVSKTSPWFWSAILVWASSVAGSIAYFLVIYRVSQNYRY